jgi:serine O-acetyltransferase
MLYAIFNHSKQLSIIVQLGIKSKNIPVFGNFFKKFFEYFIRIYFSSDISCSASIHKSVKFEHGHNIVIGSNVIIEENCIIFNGVTLGNKNIFDKINQQPIIKKNTVLSTGSKILGRISIGPNSIVGANAVVISNVPENCLAVGVPAKIKYLK